MRMFAQIVNGAVGQVRIVEHMPTDPDQIWVDITPDERRNEIRNYPKRWRWDGERFALRQKVRLSLSINAIEADGEDLAEFMVIGAPPDATDIRVMVGNHEELLAPLEVLEFRTNEPGAFAIHLADPRFYAEPDRVQVIATRPPLEVEPE